MKLISMTDFIDEIGNSTLHESYERDLAKILETKTKEEAEKLLNCKILN